MAELPDAAAKVERWLRHAQRDRTVKQLTNGKDVAGMVKDKVPDAVETVATFTLPMAPPSCWNGSPPSSSWSSWRRSWRPVPSSTAMASGRCSPGAGRAVSTCSGSGWGQALRGWAAGTLVAMALVGALVAAGLLLIGVDGWLILGLLTFLGVSVPFLGSVASSVPGLLVALAQSPRLFWMALGVYLDRAPGGGVLIQPLVMKRAVRRTRRSSSSSRR